MTGDAAGHVLGAQGFDHDGDGIDDGLLKRFDSVYKLEASIVQDIERAKTLLAQARGPSEDGGGWRREQGNASAPRFSLSGFASPECMGDLCSERRFVLLQFGRRGGCAAGRGAAAGATLTLRFASSLSHPLSAVEPRAVPHSPTQNQVRTRPGQNSSTA